MADLHAYEDVGTENLSVSQASQVNKRKGPRYPRRGNRMAKENINATHGRLVLHPTSNKNQFLVLFLCGLEIP